ncbi:MAG: SDR family NAD(P)-dependent oxidoreductase [Actinobacteria bacterium]|nr:MAG: SDR family NAD(P)-dependent oxidoreductase [Actinomycetota bacterium]
MNELEGKVAVITGAASGIGQGMRVVMADIEDDALEVAAKEVGASGAKVLAVRTDVSKGAAVDALAARTVEEFGTFHVVCNNAGVGAGGTMWELSEADWAWVLGVNLWGVIHGIRAFVPRLVEQNEGHVVNTGSIAGLTSAPMMGPYNASKHAVVTISETLQRELALNALAVRVSVLCPGFVQTRIAESDRNRPDHLRNPVEPEMNKVGRELLKQIVASGLPAAEVACQVVDAVKHERFYVLPHPEMKSIVRTRMDDILEERSPAAEFFFA